jgi:hypothetical protein
MRRHFPVILTAVVLAACGGGGSKARTLPAPSPSVDVTPPAPSPVPAGLPPVAKLTPTALTGVYLGMPTDAFVKARPHAKEAYSDADKISYNETVGAGGVTEVIYYCTRGLEPRLFEMIVGVTDKSTALATFNGVYAPLGEIDRGSANPEVGIPGYPFKVAVWTEVVLEAVPVPGGQGK